MRILVLLLLLANAGFYAWQMRQPVSESSATVRTPPLPDFVNRMSLLSEVDAAELRPRTASRVALAGSLTRETTPGSVTPLTDASEGEVCFSIGPLSDEDDPEPLRAWLQQRGGIANLRVGERREVALYWVYFPPFPDLPAAKQRIRQMRSDGIEDIFLIPRGDKANAISLGVYSHKRSLDRRLGLLKRYGYEPSVVPRYRTKKASWFDVEFPEEFAFPGEAFIERFPELDAARSGCA